MVVQIQTLAFFCASLPPTLNCTMYQPSSESLLLPHNHQLRCPPLPTNAPKMCTPWPLRKLLVQRYAQGGRLDLSKSRFRLEEDSNRPVFPTTQPSHDHNHHQEQQHGQSNNAQPSSSSSPGQVRAATAPSRISVVKRGKHKRRVTIGSNQTSSSSSSLGDVVEGGGGAEETDWPPFTDEDYIVFCFEEDGDFHVVTEENSKSQDCSEHGNSSRTFNQKSQGDEEGDSASPAYNNGNRDDKRMNRRDCFLPNKAVEEELFYFSPRLQSDGIKSLTRFKAEVDDEDENIVKARSRVDEEMDYEDIDGIKNRGQINEEEDMLFQDDLDLECPKTSMECRDGSVESTESSQSDWAQQLHLTKNDQEVGLSPSLQAQEDPSSSQNGNLESPSYTTEILLSNRTADDEESIYLSPKGGSQSDDEQSNSEESARGSSETSDTSQSETGAVQLEEDELDLDSAKSGCSISSTSSFEFPVLQWEWTGSPVKWPKSDSLRLRKPKSRRVCLRCCRF